MSIPLRRLMDVRPAESGSFVSDSVWIRLAELPDRVYELPRSDFEVVVADTGPEAAEALAWLIHQDRKVRLSRDFRFTDERQIGRLWQPNEFLEEVVRDLTPARAIDLACGVGREAVFLASMGWTVTAVDHLEDALERGRLLEQRYLGREAVNWLHGDLESCTVEGEYDLATIFFYMNRPLLHRAQDLLSPGGILLFETFTARHRAERGKPRREGLVIQPEEIDKLVPGLEIVSYSEAWREGRHTGRLLARKQS